ncbi:MAG: MobQ family relaxase [Chloroflexota bacterium]
MMATNLHFRVQVISRGQGKSAPASASYRSGTVVHVGGRSVVASASYRSGEVLHDDRLNKRFDYTRKEDVLHAEILAPEKAPTWVQDRSTLWNSVEAAEKRKDAQLARDIIAALPRGLDEATYTQLVKEFVNDNFVARGMVADVAIHTKMASDGLDNPHMHVMLTTREITADGFGPKNREWNNRAHIKEWREAFEEICNRYLDDAGSNDEISLKSYKDRGVDRVPGEHLGPNAWNLEQKGQETTKGNRNRKVKHENFMKQTFRAYREKLNRLKGKEQGEEGRPEQDAGEGGDNASDSSSTVRQVPALQSGDGASGVDPSTRQEVGRILAAMQDAKRLTASFAAQVKHYGAILKANAVALARDERTGAFDRYRHLRDISQDQSRDKDKDHER